MTPQHFSQHQSFLSWFFVMTHHTASSLVLHFLPPDVGCMHDVYSLHTPAASIAVGIGLEIDWEM